MKGPLGASSLVQFAKLGSNIPRKQIMAVEAKPQTQSLYECDFYGWVQEQSQYLKQGQFDRLDIGNLREELESLGKQQRQELENRLGVLLGHLLKWHYQPSGRSPSWFYTIREQRQRIARLIHQSPSLKPYIPEAIAIGYQYGVSLFGSETGKSPQELPLACPFSTEEIFTAELEFAKT